MMVQKSFEDLVVCELLLSTAILFAQYMHLNSICWACYRVQTEFW